MLLYIFNSQAEQGFPAIFTRIVKAVPKISLLTALLKIQLTWSFQAGVDESFAKAPFGEKIGEKKQGRKPSNVQIKGYCTHCEPCHGPPSWVAHQGSPLETPPDHPPPYNLQPPSEPGLSSCKTQTKLPGLTDEELLQPFQHCGGVPLGGPSWPKDWPHSLGRRNSFS